LEIAWTIAPALLLAMVAIPTYSTIAKHDKVPEGSKVLKVDVVANQWWWEFRYPELGVVTANELHVPTNTAVDVTLKSRDVIHSFWIPKLAGKTDVVPANVNRMWFEAPEPGDYWGQCAEFCGLAHAQMRFRVIAEPQATFDAWVAKQKAPPAPPVGDLAVQGQTLFAAKGCVVCHTVNGPDTEQTQDARTRGFGEGGAIFSAPNLTTFGDRRMMGAGLFEKNEQNLKKWIKNPEDMKPGNHMSELAAAYQGGLPTDEEVNALTAYLLHRTTDPNAAQAMPAASPTAAPGATGTPGAVPSGQVSFTVGTVGNNLQFDTASLRVKAGSHVTLALANKAGSVALQHNWVLVKLGSEDAVANAGLGAGPANSYVPPGNADVIANTKLVDGGKTGSVEFNVPPAGMYSFICTFPGHSGPMRGTFEVVP
jgi:cytochrome c oxidase subunit 2